MVWILSIPFIWYFLPVSSLLSLAAELCQKSHQMCTQWNHNSSQWRELYVTLSCGARDLSTPMDSEVQQLGLVHLFVVSGLHIMMLNKLIEKWLPHSLAWTRWPLLIFYSSLCNFEVPVTRALMQFYIRSISLKSHLNWSPSVQTMVTGILCLIINPHWASQISFLLSWSAALSLCFFSGGSGRGHQFLISVSLYCFLKPILDYFAPLSPLTILFNLFLTGVFAHVLLPLCLLSHLVPGLTRVSDLIFDLVKAILQFFTQGWTAPVVSKSPATLDSFVLVYWIFIFIIHIWLLVCPSHGKN